MDIKKVAILSSVAIVVLGGVVGFLVLRSRQNAGQLPVTADVNVPAEQPLVKASSATSTPKETTPVSVPDVQPSVEPLSTTPAMITIDENAKFQGCDDSIPDGDCDYDHLTNAQEKTFHTDLHNADTDGDGLNDGEEVLTWKSDPLNPRSIDPTMTDLDAINAGKSHIR